MVGSAESLLIRERSVNGKETSEEEDGGVKPPLHRKSHPGRSPTCTLGNILFEQVGLLAGDAVEERLKLEPAGKS